MIILWGALDSAPLRCVVMPHKLRCSHYLSGLLLKTLWQHYYYNELRPLLNNHESAVACSDFKMFPCCTHWRFCTDDLTALTSVDLSGIRLQHTVQQTTSTSVILLTFIWFLWRLRSVFKAVSGCTHGRLCYSLLFSGLHNNMLRQPAVAFGITFCSEEAKVC